MPTFADILSALEADILCFQEVKSSRSGILKGCAIPPSYHAFFSFPVKKTGYSGVSTYVRTELTTPTKAEEGLCGILQPKPPLTNEERVSTPAAYPQRVLVDSNDIDFKDLDGEGRTLVIDFGLFVLINVYCPNDGNGTQERNKYKADFHTVLEARVKGLVELEGREVIVVGDLNACAAIIDHCEGELMVARGVAEGLEGEEGFWGKDVRRWMRDWMVSEDGTGGHLIDITRRLWPDRKAMYTCWNTKISARDSNYGTRIDYIMITPGLLPWVRAADIQPHIKGSDHCPVYVDLYDEIVDSSGVTVKLQDVLGLPKDSVQEPPRIASKFWDEYSGKQRLLQQFFGKPNAGTPASAKPAASAVPYDTLQGISEPSKLKPVGTLSSSSPSHDTPTPSSPSLSTPPATQPSQPSKTPQSPKATLVKRKLTTDTLARNTPSKKRQKQVVEKKSGQATLASYFAKPKTSSATPNATTSMLNSSSRCSDDIVEAFELNSVDITDHRLALLLSEESESSSSQSQGDSTTSKTKQAWSSLMAPVQPPRCTVHGELAREWTVTKPGPNKGKKFFICSRPVGPGYDKGRAERLREHVDPKWRCDYFKWSSEARRQRKEGG